jgi:hypothetical protein
MFYKDDSWIFVTLATCYICICRDVSSGLLSSTTRSVKDVVSLVTSTMINKDFRSGGGDYIIQREGRIQIYIEVV